MGVSMRMWRWTAAIGVAAVVLSCAIGQGPGFGKRKPKIEDGVALDIRHDSAVEKAVDEVVERVKEWDGEPFWGVVAVMRNGTVVYRKGFGRSGDPFSGRDDEDSRPLDGVSVLDIASISKQFACATIFRLQAKGILKITDPVARWFPDTGENGRRVTLEMLMSHTSGMPPVGGMQALDFPDRDAAVRLALTTEGYVAPQSSKGERARFVYANAGYTVLAAVIEKASGKKFEECVRDEIFAPAGLKTTGMLDGERVPMQRATARVVRRPDPETGQETIRRMGILDDGWGWGIRGAGGVLTCADDLLRWHKVLNGDTIVDEAAKKEMFTVRRSNYALGWIVELAPSGAVRQSHSGSTRGYRSYFARYPETDSAIVILSNENGNPIRLGNEVEKAVFAGERDEVEIAIRTEPVQWSMGGTAVITTGLETKVSKIESDSGLTIALDVERWAPPGKDRPRIATIRMSDRRARIIASMLERRASMADEIGGGGIGIMLSRRPYAAAAANGELIVSDGCEIVVIDSYSGFDPSTGRKVRDSRIALTVSDTEKKATPVVLNLDRPGAERLAASLRAVTGAE